MAFSTIEIAHLTEQIESIVWSKRRPPLHLRSKLREGQHITRNEVELFMVRPRYNNPHLFQEESIAKARFVKSRNVWRIFWKRADNKWHSYNPCPEVAEIEAFLHLVQEDKHACFWG